MSLPIVINTGMMVPNVPAKYPYDFGSHPEWVSWVKPSDVITWALQPSRVDYAQTYVAPNATNWSLIRQYNGLGYSARADELFTESPVLWPTNCIRLYIYGVARMVAFDVKESAPPWIIKPSSDFSGSPISGVCPLIVQFTDLSTGDPKEWLWNFGDGYTSTDRFPSHVYLKSGSYDVSLKVTNSKGSDTKTRTAYITATSPELSSRIRWQIPIGPL